MGFRFGKGVVVFLALASGLFGQGTARELRVAAAGVDTYRVVFPAEYLGTIKWSSKEYERMMVSRRRSLAKQMNAAGAEAYRFEAGNDGLSIFKIDKANFEYEVFETVGSFHFAITGFEEKLKAHNLIGFRVVGHEVTLRNCETDYGTTDQPGTLWEKCENKDLFFVERPIGSRRKVEQIVVRVPPTWKRSTAVTGIVSELREYLAKGYYPVRTLSKLGVLLEKAPSDEAIDTSVEVQVVGTTDEKSINELARQGYRISVADQAIAIMVRNHETVKIPITYAWAKPYEKNFARDLGRLEETGFVFRASYPDRQGYKSTLLFEQTADPRNKRAEFRVLDFDFTKTEQLAEGKVLYDLTPASKDAVKQLNDLATQGFVVRSVIGKKVLLERQR